MAYQKIQRFESEFNIGLNNFVKDISTVLNLSKNSYNTSMGIHLGHGPRYGMAPIPGQCASVSATIQTSTILSADQAIFDSTSSLYNGRVKTLGIIPFTFGTAADITQKKTHYAWILTNTQNSIDFIITCKATSPGVYTYINDIAQGLHTSPGGTFFPESGPVVGHMGSPLDSYRLIDQSINFCATAALQVSGSDWPMQWVLGNKATVGDSTHTAIPAFAGKGLPPEYNTGNHTYTTRSLRFYNLMASAAGSESTLAYDYNYPSVTLTSAFYIPSFKQASNANIALPSSVPVVTDRMDGATPAFSSVDSILLNDSAATCNSAHTLLLTAAKKPIAMVVQDWELNTNGLPHQYVDLTAPFYNIKSLATKDSTNSSILYQEDGTPVNTCFCRWPGFTTGTPLSTGLSIDLGAANSGLLRANTVYEFTFSVFDKQYGVEMNVGAPAKVQTGNDDFVALSVFLQRTNTQVNALGTLDTPFGTPGIFPAIFPSGSSIHINYLQFRMYYRALGSYQWLPALFMDAAQFYYYPNFSTLYACLAPIAGQTAGQPGDFNDYSPLPQKPYIDVKVFQSRVFWCAPDSITFSPRNNGFVYPLRNQTPCPAGEFKGMTNHVYPGQAQQGGRLLVWGTKEAYVGIFTGSPTYATVQIDDNTTGSFPEDGTDFTLQTWTSFTAFSHRAAVVAEGVLYYWGPQGIFQDGGVDIPTKVSLPLHPDIHTIYDPNLTDNIFATYNNETFEVIWVYTRKNSTTGFSSALIYNVIDGLFYFYEFSGQVDWGQKIQIDKAAVNRGTAGYRTILGTRATSSATLQRPVFFDVRNRAGDWFPKTEFLVNQFSAPSGGSMTLTLDPSYTNTNFNLISIGDTLTIHQATDYSLQATTTDFIGTITAKNLVANTITIAVPSSISTYYSTLLTADNYVPVWVSSINGFPFVLETDLWAPGGMKFWAAWLFAHLIIKTTLLDSVSAQTVSLSYRSPIAGGYITNVITLANALIADFQVYTQLKNTNQAFEGQGLQLSISGIQNGAQWVLQYLGLDATMMEGDHLMTFQG